MSRTTGSDCAGSPCTAAAQILVASSGLARVKATARFVARSTLRTSSGFWSANARATLSTIRLFASPLALLTSLMLVPVLIARVVNGASQAKASMSPWTSASTISGGARSTIGTSEGARPPEAR